MIIAVRKFAIIFAAIPFLLLAGCDADDSAGTNANYLDLTIGGTGFMAAVSNVSCGDKMTAAAGGTTPARSVSSISLSYPNVTLYWKRSDLDLYLQYVRVTLQSSRLAGGTQTIPVDATELEDLLGAKDGIIVQAARPLIPATLGPPATAAVPAGTFSSTASTTLKGHSSAGLTYQPCGLVIGGIKLANPNDTSSFSVSVTIELLGVASSNLSNPDQTIQQVVRKTFTTYATYQ